MKTLVLNWNWNLGQKVVIYLDFKSLYPPNGTAKAVPERVHLTVFPFYMCFTNQNWGFKIRIFDWPFWNLENLYPPKGSAKALPMGSNWFSYGLLSLVNEEWSFNFALVIRQKNSVKILYCAGGRTNGRMDGWMDGRQSKVSFDFPYF